MSWRSDSSQLVSDGWCSSAYPGLGITGAEMRAAIGTGADGPGPMYNEWDSGDDAKEFRLVPQGSWPSGIVLNEDGSLVWPSPANGTYSLNYNVYVDGQPLSGGPSVATITVGESSSISGDVLLANFVAAGTFSGGVASLISGAVILNDYVAAGTFSGGSSSSVFGNVTLENYVAAGTFMSIVPAEFGGDVQLGDFSASGTFFSVSSGGLDPTTPLGRVRLKIGDYFDLPILPDSVIYAALAETGDNVNRTSAICAQYILGMLSHKTHKRLNQLESWSGEEFTNYVKFLQMTILNPNLTTVAPIPYSGKGCEDHSIRQFMQDWKDGYLPGSVVIPPQTGGRVMEYAYS